jgi:hypothetical protein
MSLVGAAPPLDMIGDSGTCLIAVEPTDATDCILWNVPDAFGQNGEGSK